MLERWSDRAIRRLGAAVGAVGATVMLVLSWPMPRAMLELWGLAALLVVQGWTLGWAATNGSLRRCRRLLRLAAGSRKVQRRSFVLSSDCEVKLVDRTLRIDPIEGLHGTFLQVTVRRAGLPAARKTQVVAGAAGEHPIGDPGFDARVRLVRAPSRMMASLDGRVRPWLAAFVDGGGRIDGDALSRGLPPDAHDDEVLAVVADLERLADALVPPNVQAPKLLLQRCRDEAEPLGVRRTMARLLLREHGTSMEARLLAARLRRAPEDALRQEARVWTSRYGEGAPEDGALSLVAAEAPDDGGLAVVREGGELALLDEGGLSLSANEEPP